MGGKQSKQSGREGGSEMESGKQFKTVEQQDELLPSMADLNHDAELLKSNVRMISQAIDDMFQEAENDGNESNQDLEKRLQEMTASNQTYVKRLTKHLERHAKLVTNGREANEAVMAAVIDLVTTINSYMTMLIRNIRKLKRLMSATENSPKTATGKKDLYEHWRRGQKEQRKEDLIYDVINEHQDVDAMLAQLIETEAHREELESDMVSVLVIWRDYRDLQACTEEFLRQDQIEKEVLSAADSVAQGLVQLNCNKRAYTTASQSSHS